MPSPRSLLLLFAGALAALAVAGCDFADDGPRTTQTRDVGSFTQIDNRGSVDVRLRVGEKQRVKVWAGEKVIDDVRTEVHNGTLEIAFDHDGWGGNDVVVEASVPKLTGIEASGSGDIDADGIKAGAFEVRSDGSADIALAGAAVATRVRRDWRIAFWAGIAVFALLMGMGDHTPLASIAFYIPLYWKFRVADTVADFGLHGALFIGAPRRAADIPNIVATLSALRLELHRDGAAVDRGSGSNVLDGPLQAIAHLMRVLAAQDRFPEIAVGEIITTGTLTAAWPVEPGQRWSTQLSGVDLPGATLSFT